MARDSARISVSFSTKERLLDSAEELFAQHGIHTASMRDITGHAGTNIASVNYHFGSKEGLLEAIFERRIKPVNEERMRLFDIAEQHFAPNCPPIDALLYALMAPAMRCISNSPSFARLAGRVQTDPNDELRERVILSQFKELAARAFPLFQKALPHLTMEELWWRMHFIVGSMTYTWTNYRDIDIFTKNVVNHPSVQQLTKRLIHAAKTTLLAPPTSEEKLEFGGLERVYMLPDASLPELLGESLANV
ncbi:MAG: TetR family transcriptional regulator [Planctomycetes bacterium]|nr:TetR family transcriptional regulator [Planctomycetota bacterium]